MTYPLTQLAALRRRYYLHRRIRRIPAVRVRATRRLVEIPPPVWEKLTIQQKAYLDELARFGYNIQLIIA